MENFKELSFEEMLKVDGGGWIADAVEWFVAGLKCNCDNGAPSGAKGYGGIVGYQTYGGQS